MIFYNIADKLSEDLSLEIEKLSSKHDTNQAKKGEDFKNKSSCNSHLIISIQELTFK